jgi:MATE family multidrug resistance protein
MGASGFWIALIVGLTIAAVALSALLRRVARENLPQADLRASTPA